MTKVLKNGRVLGYVKIFVISVGTGFAILIAVIAV
jgi:hypothetical protein